MIAVYAVIENFGRVGTTLSQVVRIRCRTADMRKFPVAGKSSRMIHYNNLTECHAMSEKSDVSKCTAPDRENKSDRAQRALLSAEQQCADRGLRLTPVRRKVLEILLEDQRALGAYAILDVLREAGLGSQPPAVYRALDFLSDVGLVHKIERMNAFVACDHPSESHAPVFLICRVCDNVAEAHTALAEDSLGALAGAAGFQIERTIVEAEGVCPKCVETQNA